MTEQEQQPIAAEEARRIRDEAIRARLGDEWNDEISGWTVVTEHDYMARLNNGKQTIDFYVDLQGNVKVEEKSDYPSFESGRLTAWMVLLASLVTAFILARLAGFL